MNTPRWWLVFRKELSDVLRDRRTLLANIVVPLLLYPVLMMAGMAAMSFEKGQRETEHYEIAVRSAAEQRWLEQVLAADRPEDSPARSQPARKLRPKIISDQFVVKVLDAPADEVITQDQAVIWLQVDPPPRDGEPVVHRNRTVHLVYDSSTMRAAFAANALYDILARHNRQLVERRLASLSLDAGLLEPLAIKERSLATPQRIGSVLLGSILPFLLVIMTVTGAVYPAIDVTVGERERGTLETLMTSPLPVHHIMVGKFVLVAVVALITTLLNLVSMGATVHFSGITTALADALPASTGSLIPLHVVPLIALAMLPLVVLFSALLLATCSFARSFKEAQNYIMPVIVVAMVPAIGASYMPSVELSGPTTMIPVANVVFLLRDLFADKFEWSDLALVFASTSLYAGAAVLLAARLYGQEAVLFNDMGSYRALLTRRHLQPAPNPTATAALGLLAITFPLSFYWQTALAGAARTPAGLAALTASLMLVVFLLPGLLVSLYLKFNLRTTFSLGTPRWAAWPAAALVAAGVPVLAQALAHWQLARMPLGEDVQAALTHQQDMLTALPLWVAIGAFALLPAVCEEFLFRGFLLSALRDKLPPLAAWLLVGLLFGLFHADLHRIPTTSLIGALLAFVCWQTGSLWPAVLIHLVNNATMLVALRWPALADWIGAERSPSPTAVATSVAAVAAGLVLLILAGKAREAAPSR